MAPKPKVEAVAAPVDLPDQSPSFENDTFMDELLNFAKQRQISQLEAGVARALGFSEDYMINLPRGVIVDFNVECLLFASEHSFPARKAYVFLKWLTELRQSVETTGSTDEARIMFKEHMVTHAERSANRDASGDASAAANAHPSSGEEPQGGSSAAQAKPTAPPPKPAPGGKKKGGPAVPTDADAEAAARARAELNTYLTIADMGHVAEFVVSGLLQHYLLYAHVAACADKEPSACQEVDHHEVTMMVQTPMRPLPLQRAIPGEIYEQQQESKRKAAEAELQRLREEEEEKRENERIERERKEEEENRLREEHEANTLYFEKQGTDKAVAVVHEDLQKDTAARQANLLARLAKLEEALHLTQ